MAYQATPHYKLKQRRLQEELQLNERLLRVAFQQDLTVRFGPFAGMRYLSEASCSQILPKVLGSYEEPIHPWIEEIVERSRYDRILNVGCAEGYYAVGFALRMQHVSIYAFDIDPQALGRAALLIEQNNLADRVSLKAECNFDVLQECGGPRTLIFCDIEGAEDRLLDPAKAPRLSESGVLVEAHDFIKSGISDRLIARFASTHKIRMVVDYPGRIGNYGLPQFEALSPDERLKLTDEVRPPQMRFLFMEPL
jgi:hypothetical protein